MPPKDSYPSLIPVHRHRWEPIKKSSNGFWVYVCTVVGCPHKGEWVSPRRINRRDVVTLALAKDV